MRFDKRFPVVAAGFALAGFLIATAQAQQPPAPDQPPPPSAQQTEKRIALVIGNGAYQKAPLATAANDAGLIAQTLQAAGFDVVGARDLDGNTLRSSFHDFVEKAQASGPDTVAFVYISGYGVQLAGENYFIPVDSTLSRDVDIPVEGLRVGDYIRQLSALPLKAGVFVLDAARQQPFIEGGQKIASGLALVEPDPRVLIAFNAAPGTVAPEETGNYGAYAQALAEMIRSGGLPLPELFNRVRLRVNDLTKGAQVPWDTQKIDTQFVFFDRAADAPPEATPAQSESMRDKPIRDLSAQDAYSAALDRDTLQGYEDFLAAYPDDPMAKRVRAIVAARREAITWRRTYRADTPDAYWSYLKRYPNGPHADDARRRLSYLAAAPEPPPQFAQYDYDMQPPPPEEYAYVDQPVLMFSDPEFGFAPPPPPPVYFLPPPPPDFIVLPPPIFVDDVYVLPRPLFVPLPIFVRPPFYVRPPHDNIIYANIHNTTVINNVINRPGNGRFDSLHPGPGGPPRFGGAASLPPSVAQRANLIQEGRAPRPLSASINPRANLRPGVERGAPQAPRGPGGFGAASNGGPGAPSGPGALNRPGEPNFNAGPNGRQRPALPGANALPVPGRGAPNITPPGGPENRSAISGRQGPQGRPQGGPQGRPQGMPPGGPRPNITAPNRPNSNGSGRGPGGRDVSRPAGGPPQQFQRPNSAPQIQRPVAPPQIQRQAAPQFQRPTSMPQVQRNAPPQQRPAPTAAPQQPRMAAPPPRPAAPPRMAAPPPRPAPPPRQAPAKKCEPGQHC
ncbi:MAG: caspase-like domain-containing protein [Bradyrhizobiaceae bacterium]|nr:MAG: caspase-like domain-containing protein [Bradyrhizobiaceae bacterium]